MSRDLTVVADIVDAAKLAVEFVDGYDFERFANDLKTQSAVLNWCAYVGTGDTELWQR